MAVALAARDFAARHLDDCAMLRVLGQPQRRIAAVYALEFLLADLMAIAGVMVGLIAQQGFVALLSGLVSADLPAGRPARLAGLGAGLALLAGFGLPPVLQLAAVRSVIRRDFGAPRASGLIVGGLGVAACWPGVLALIARRLDAGRASRWRASASRRLALRCWRGCAWPCCRLLPGGPQTSAAWPRWLLPGDQQVNARPGPGGGGGDLAVPRRLLALALLVLLHRPDRRLALGHAGPGAQSLA